MVNCESYKGGVRSTQGTQHCPSLFNAHFTLWPLPSILRDLTMSTSRAATSFYFGSFDPLAFAGDDERYLALYDLCGGDPTLVDTIKGVYPVASVGYSTTTPPLVAATLSPTNDDLGLPPPTVGGKWVPSFHPSLVPPPIRYTPTAHTPDAPVAVFIIVEVRIWRQPGKLFNIAVKRPLIGYVAPPEPLCNSLLTCKPAHRIAHSCARSSRTKPDQPNL